MPLGKFKGVQLVATILRGEKERRNESKDAGVLEAQDEWQVAKITAGKEHNAQNRTERLLPTEREFSATGSFSFSVLFDLMISAFLPLEQCGSSQPTEYAALYYQTSTVNKDLASDFQI